MATLQKFKLLATQCGVAPSPTRSPMTSPVVQFPRRKSSLRMLLTRSSGRRLREREIAPPQPRPEERRRGTLKDLFTSSPAGALQEEEEEDEEGKSLMNGGDKYCQVWRMKKEVVGAAGWIGFRHRSILRRAWRPVLIGIPESDDRQSD
ncbi:hypothetical protein LINPERPRIM_LOCUS4964 [Linum perenne]